MSEGIERLRFLLSGIAAPSAHPIPPAQNLPTNSLILPGQTVFQHQTLVQQQFMKDIQLDANQFRNQHMDRVELVKKLMKEQDDYVNEILKRFDDLNQELKSLKDQFDTLQLIKNATQDISEKKQELKSQIHTMRKEMIDETKKIQEKMLQFQRYQQDALSSAGFPMFKVSDSVSDQVDQHWILAPYLEEIRGKR